MYFSSELRLRPDGIGLCAECMRCSAGVQVRRVWRLKLTWHLCVTPPLRLQTNNKHTDPEQHRSTYWCLKGVASHDMIAHLHAWFASNAKTFRHSYKSTNHSSYGAFAIQCRLSYHPQSLPKMQCRWIAYIYFLFMHYINNYIYFSNWMYCCFYITFIGRKRQNRQALISALCWSNNQIRYPQSLAKILLMY